MASYWLAELRDASDLPPIVGSKCPRLGFLRRKHCKRTLACRSCNALLIRVTGCSGRQWRPMRPAVDQIRWVGANSAGVAGWLSANPPPKSRLPPLRPSSPISLRSTRRSPPLATHFSTNASCFRFYGRNSDEGSGQPKVVIITNVVKDTWRLTRFLRHESRLPAQFTALAPPESLTAHLWT